ncbi:MAG: hypothetical protein M3Q98_03710 [Actinomycetota bacterium]|nr:hypothetical protein [Actinomycetota bacterium]
MTVTAGVGYWRLNSPGVRWRAPFLWKVMAPLAIAIAGYYPGRRLGILDDLPPNVMRQWSSWCMHPDYMLSELPEIREEYAAVTLPLASLSFTDDELMSRESIAGLDRLYTGVNQVHMRYTPEQLGVERMGHFAFFRENRVDLWDELVLPFLAQQ